jgi:hypothetical protein
MKTPAHEFRYHGRHEHITDWPVELTPDLKQRLIQEKTERVQAFIKLRDHPTGDCYETHCQCS